MGEQSSVPADAGAIRIGRRTFERGMGNDFYNATTGVTLYEVNGHWAVADRGGWVDGAFEDPETAVAAVDVAWDPKTRIAYAEMQMRVNHSDREDRLITRADLDTVTA